MTLLARRVTTAIAMAAACALVPLRSGAQNTVACDFDIADNLGQFVFGSVMHLEGRQGAGSTRGTFYLINGNTEEMDVDHDGWSPDCDYNNLFISQRTNLVHTSDPSLAIPGVNIIISNFPLQLGSGETAIVNVYVEVPVGTVAGTYIGRIEVRDDVIFSVPNSAGELLNVDVLGIQVTVHPDPEIVAVDPDEPIALDSIVVTGRAGQRATGAFRLANTGNAELRDVRLAATDLRSESAVGITIPSSRVTFNPPSFAAIGVNDTVRVAISVDIPRGILGGRYRGALIVQAEGVEEQRIPLVVVVESARGIVFASNPVRSSLGDVARIAFNGDPGTQFRIGIFDMAGLLVWTDLGEVFPGVGGTPEAPTPGADFAVNYNWPLTNARGEAAASGMYLVVVESTVNGRRQLAQAKLMIIR